MATQKVSAKGRAETRGLGSTALHSFYYTRYLLQRSKEKVKDITLPMNFKLVFPNLDKASRKLKIL